MKSFKEWSESVESENPLHPEYWEKAKRMIEVEPSLINQYAEMSDIPPDVIKSTPPEQLASIYMKNKGPYPTFRR